MHQTDGQRLRAIMESKGVSHQGLADQMGVAKKTVYQYLNSVSHTVEVRRRLAKALKCRQRDLMGV